MQNSERDEKGTPDGYNLCMRYRRMQNGSWHETAKPTGGRPGNLAIHPRRQKLLSQFDTRGNRQRLRIRMCGGGNTGNYARHAREGTKTRYRAADLWHCTCGIAFAPLQLSSLLPFASAHRFFQRTLTRARLVAQAPQRSVTSSCAVGLRKRDIHILQLFVAPI